jgi:hypothetical protein
MTNEYEEWIKVVEDVKKKERERCARIALTAGLGEPHSMPPYSVRELIAHRILEGDTE